MTVTGYLTLYTTLLGWQQYENLWGIAVDTGLIYLPFVSLILKSAVDPFTSMGAKDAATIAVRRLTLNVLLALLVIALTAAPTVHLDPKVLHYEPLCSEQPKDAKPGNTGTTYDSLPTPTGVKVPVFWYLVMSLANGVTHAASVGLGCAPLDYRNLHNQLNLSKIHDVQLQEEVAQFYQDCYVPAFSAFKRNQFDPATAAQIKQSLVKNGPDDVGWLGSNTFLNITGFYEVNSANKTINGFSYSPTRDIEEGQVGHPQWGKPDCRTWWKDPNSGIQVRLKKSLPPSLLQSLLHFGNSALQDAAVKTLITHSFAAKQPTISSDFRGYESLNNNVSGDWTSRFIGGQLGTLMESLSFYPKLHLLMNALPVIQGCLLFAFYAFLGLAIPFSNYRISFTVTAAVVLFSLIFCSYLWHLVQWFDNYLIQALYASFAGIPGMGGVLSSSLQSPNQMFVDMIIGGMYIVLPLFWLTVMGWAGIQAGNFIAGALSTMSASAENAGRQAGGTANSLVMGRINSAFNRK